MSLTATVPRALRPGLLLVVVVTVASGSVAALGQGTTAVWLGCGLIAGFSLSGSV